MGKATVMAGPKGNVCGRAPPSSNDRLDNVSISARNGVTRIALILKVNWVTNWNASSVSERMDSTS